MVIGLCTIDLHLPESGSLKGKRQVLKGLKERIRNRFNVSIAEVDGQDLWQRATLGVACVSTDRTHVHQVLDRVLDHIGEVPELQILQQRIEYL